MGLGGELSNAIKKKRYGKNNDRKKLKKEELGAGRKNSPKDLSSSQDSGSGSLGSSLKQHLSNEKTGGKKQTSATSYVRATPPAATPTAAPTLSSGIGAAVRGESVGNVPVPHPYSGPSNYLGPYTAENTVPRTLGELAGTIPAVNTQNWTAAGSRFGQQGGWTVAGQNLQKSINQGNPSIELWRLYENMPAEINANNYGTWLNEQLQQGGTGGAGGEYSDVAQLRMAAYANQANTLLPAGMQRGAGNVIGQKAPDLASVYQDQASFDADAEEITNWLLTDGIASAERNDGVFTAEGTQPEALGRMAQAWGLTEEEVADWYINSTEYGGAPQYIVRGEGEERAPYETGFEGGVSTMQDAYSLLARDDFDRMVAIERDTPVAEGAGPRAIQRYNNPDLDAADRVIEQWAGMTEAHAAERGLTREQWIDRAVMAHDQMAGEYDAYLARIAQENGFDASTNLPEMKQWTEAWENLEQVWERTEKRRAGLQDKYRGVFADPLYAEGGSREPAVGRKDAYTAIEAVYRMVMSDDAQEVTDLQEASSQYNRRYRTLGPSEDVQYEQFVTTMGARDWRDYHFELLSSTEQGVFDTLYREDPKQALEFLRDMQEELDYRYQYGATEGMRQYATENFGTATVATGLSFLYNINNNLQGAANLLRVALNGGAEGMSPYDPSSLSGKLSTAIRGGISDRLKDYLKVGKVFNAGTLYSAVTSSVDSLIGFYTAGPAYAALMGAGAFNNDLAVQLEKNPDAQKALAHALASGVVETVSEYCSLDHLAKATGNIFYDLLTQAAIEGQEELVAAVANRWCDEWLNGGYGEVEQNAFRMILTGETDPFYAWVEANADWWNQALEETLTGFLSGGMSSGGNSASTHIQQNAADVRAGYSIYQSGNLEDVIKLGESSKNAETRELAGKLRQMYGVRGESDSIARDAARMAGRLSDQVQSEQRGQQGTQSTQGTQDVQQDDYTDAEQEAPQDELVDVEQEAPQNDIDLVEVEDRGLTEQRALEAWQNSAEQAAKEQTAWENRAEQAEKVRLADVEQREAPREAEQAPETEGRAETERKQNSAEDQVSQQDRSKFPPPYRDEHGRLIITRGWSYDLRTKTFEFVGDRRSNTDTHMSRRTAERRLAADMEALGLSGDESGARAIRQYQQDAERLRSMNRQAADQTLDLGNANRSGTSKLTINMLRGMGEVKTGVELAQEQAQATQEREEIADRFLNAEETAQHEGSVRRMSDLTDEQRQQYYADLSHEDQALREQYLGQEGIGARGKAAVQAYQQAYSDMLANLNARYGIDTGTRAEQRAEDQAPPAPVQEETAPVQAQEETAPVQAQEQTAQEQAPDVEEQAERRAEENAPPAPQTEETAEEQAREEPAEEPAEQRDQAQEETAEESAEENEQRADQANEEIRDAIEESGEEVSEDVEDALTGEEQTDRQQQRDRAERDQETRKKRKKSEYAAVGRLYRQLAQELDTEAQGVLAENLSRYVSDMLYDNGYQGTRRSRREMANAVLSAALDPSSISPNVRDAIAHDRAAMTALNDLTGKLVQRSELFRRRAALDTLLTSRTQSAIKGEGGKLQTVHIEGIETGEDGETLFRVRRGDSTSTVKADSIEIGRSEAWAAPLAQYASSFGTNADLVFNQYTAGNEGNVNAFIRAFDMAARYAEQGRNVESMMQDSGIREVLTEDQARAAYDIGRARRVQRAEQTAAARRSKGRGVKTGNVDISEIRGLAGTLTQQQRDAIMALKKLAPALGINIKLFASEAVEGRYQRENGSWNDSTRTLSIDIHAGANAIEDSLKNGMMYTFGHELTHYIKQFADAALWDDYQTFVISAIAGKDATYLQGKVKALMEANEGMTEDEAIEDVVADASADCLRLMSEEDARALAELEQLSRYSPNLFERIVDFIKRAAARIRSVIKTAYGSTSRESATYYRAAQLMADQLEEMAKKWNAMLVQAARNANESITQDVLDKVHAQMEAFERGEITAPAIETAEQTAEQTETEEIAEETAAEETAQEETAQEEPAAETDEEMRDGEKVDPDTGLTLSEAIQSAKSLDARDSWAAADLLRNYVTPAAVIDPSTGLVDELNWWRGTPEQRAEFLAERQSRLERAKKRAITDTHIDQRNGTSVKTDAGLFCAQDSYIPMVYALAANQLLGDLSMGNAGARYYNEYEDGRYGFTGEKRHQHPLIEHLLDGEYGARMSYSTIEKGLQEFVQADQEGRLPKDTLTNRRLELVFDTMLSYGYEAFGYPMLCAPDPLYVELKATMEGTKYNGLDAEPPRYAYSWQDLYLRERSGDEAGLDIAMRNPQYETNDVDELAAMAQSGDPSAFARQMYEQLYARPAEAAGADDGAHEAGFTDEELQTLHDVGVGISEDGQSATATDVHQSQRSWNESEYVKAREASIKILSERLGVTEDEARKFIDDINSVAAIITGDRVRYDYTPAEGFINPDGDPISALKGNSEYKDTLDFSTLCAKRIIFTGTMSAIQSRLKNAALDEYDFILIRKMMLDRKYTVPCAFCYVESTRKNNGRVIRQFLDKYAAAQQSGQKFVTGTVDKNGVDHRKYFEPNKSFNGTIESFNTPAGFDATMTEFPDVMAAYLAFMNSKGTAKPKLVEMRTDYRGEILERFKTPVSVRARNAAGGLRLQSFSDFEMVTLIDMMQAVMDMSRVGLMSQAYTKVAAFPMIFGATGIKINLSLVAKGLDADGHIIFDDVEGMRADDAFTARELYSENVGTILVAGSDEVVRAAMADDRIDFIIPYHRSSWSGVNQVMLGLYNYHDFTKLQSEIDKSTGKKTKHPIYPSEYWNKDLDTGEFVDRTGDENAKAYLELCKRRGLVPKFEEYKDVSGYWKTLIDFKMYDNDGNSAPQQVVKPNFNMEQAMQYMAGFNKERADNDALPAAQDVVDDFVAGYRAAQGRKPGSSQEILTQGLEEQGYDIRELMGKKGRKSTAKKSRAKKGTTAASDVHLSARVTDDAYMAAVERGDMAEAQRMVDEAAQAAGYDTNYLVWRGDNAAHNVLMQPRDMEDYDGEDYEGGNLGHGLYFTPVRSYAERFASNGVLRKFYLNADIADLSDGTVAAEMSQVVDEFVEDTGMEPTNGELFDELLERLEKNAVRARGVGGFSYGAEEIAVQESWQAKLADPVTYDENGDVIPLSERFNRNNEDIRYSQREDVTQSEAFRRWFGDSKIVNEDGTPMVMYHGTDAYDEFNVFKRGKYGYLGPGIYLSGTMDYAQRYANRMGYNGRVYELYAKVENPLYVTTDTPAQEILKAITGRDSTYQKRAAKQASGTHILTSTDIRRLQEKGYDGIVWKYGQTPVEVSVFSPEQLKSATNNNGEYDINNPDIRFSDRDPEDITNREILAAALETAAATPEELHRLQNYQKRLGTLRETQQKMEDLQARLTRLRSEGHKDTEEVVRQLITNGKTLQNKIDRIDRTLLNIERMGSIREILNREKAELREQYQQRMKERVAKAKAEQRQKFDAEMTQRDARWQERLNAAEEARKATAARADERVQRTNERWGAALEQQRERTREANLERRAALSGMRAAERRADRAETEQYRARLEKYVKEMRDWVTVPSGKHPVPDFMRGPLGDFLESLDWSSRRYQAGGDMTQNDLRTFEAMERMRRAISQLRSQQSEDLDSAAQEFSGYIDLPPAFVEEFDSIVQSMRRSFELGATLTGTPINRMNAEQLKAITRILQVLNSALRNMNTLVSNSLYQDATDAANATISDLAELGEMRDRGAMAGRVSDFLNWTETTPVYAFKRFGRGGTAIFEGLQNGWDILAHNSADLIEYAKEAYTAQEAREWTRSAQEFTVTDSNGDDHTFQMTAAQIMSLYCLSHRAQAMGHILGGGIKVAEFRQGRKTVSQADNYTLTESDVERITGTLTERQIEVANTLQRYMSTTLSEWGNEVSMQRYGFRMFTEGEYFPIEVDSNNMRAVDEQAHENSLFRLLNMGFTKALVPNANNALVIRDIFEVFSEHGTDMAKYNALALPILDALKWYNYIEKVQGRNGQHTTRSTQKALERAYGSGGKSYIVHLIRDLNGVSEGGRNDSFASRMLSNYKVAAVAANLRVALLQPTSMPRAAYRISPKYLLKAQAGNPVKAARAAREACGIALWKSLGFYDTNISRNVREQVRHEDTAVDRIREASMKLAEWGDAWTLGVIYRAVKAEMRDLQPGLEEGSAEYDDHLNKRMREIIYETQVVDSTMTRSDIMRSKGISQLATSFMSEPTLSLNMLNDGIFEYRMNRRAGRGNRQTLLKIARATGAFTVTSLMAALAESLFQGMRDDDDYEEFWKEKFLPALVGEGGLKSFLASNLGMDFNLLNNIPYVKDIMSMLLQGYDNGTPMTEWLTTASKAMTNFGKYTSGENENMTWYSWVYPALQSLSQASGIPVSAAMREFVSAYNTFLAGPMHTAKIQSYTDYDSAIAERLYARIRNGDEAGIAWIRERAAANGVDLENKRLRNKLKALINEELERGDIDPDEAEELLRTWAGLTADKAESAVAGVRYHQETDLEWDELADDYIMGRITADGYMQAKMTYGGKSQATAQAEVLHLDYERATGHKWSDLSADYNAGELSRAEVKQALMTYGGKTEAQADEQIDKYDYAGVHGTQDGHTKTWRLYDAWHDGGNYRAEAQALLDSGWTKGEIASSVAKKIKPEYLPIRGTAAGDAMLEEILDLYESFGYPRDYERDYIARKW